MHWILREHPMGAKILDDSRGGCRPASEAEAWAFAEVERLRAVMRDLAIAADTAELMLRETHPAAAQSLRRKVSAARALDVVEQEVDGS